jgi:hypothetical protein
MVERRKGDRRTGVIFLVLVAATNVVVWMEPVARARVTGEPAASSEIRVALGTCFFAVGLSLVGWVLGRRPSPAERLSVSKARRLGLRLSLLSAALNLVLVGTSLRLAGPPYLGPISDLSLLSIAWCLISLPVQLAAAYFMGRGSRSAGRREAASPPRTAERSSQ